MSEVRVVAVEGRRIEVRSWAGDPERLPILLWHGAAQQAGLFDDLVRALAPHPVFAPQAPGRAGSAGPPCGSVAELAALAAQIPAELGVERCLLAGHSLGGAVAIERALMHPAAELVGVALIATGARLRVHPSVLALAEAGVEAGRAPPLAEAVFKPGVSPALVEAVTALGREVPPRTGLADWRAADAFDRLDAIGAAELPALVVGGSADALTPPRYARYLADHWPRAELEILEGEGHLLVVESPQRVGAVLRSFAERLVS